MSKFTCRLYFDLIGWKGDYNSFFFNNYFNSYPDL